MRYAVLIFVVGCGLFLGCAEQGVGTEEASARGGPENRSRIVWDALQQSGYDFAFTADAFPAVMEEFQKASGQSVHVNWREIEKAIPDIREQKITVALADVSLVTALERILTEAGGGTRLHYDIEGGVIQVDTLDRHFDRLDIRVYNVRDLLGEHGPRFVETHICFNCSCPPRPVPKKSLLPMHLVNLIKSSIAIHSWYPNGVSTINYLKGYLVISQTPANHRFVCELLERLRNERNSAQENKKALATSATP
jgi:hypothetical protein